MKKKNNQSLGTGCLVLFGAPFAAVGIGTMGSVTIGARYAEGYA